MVRAILFFPKAGEDFEDDTGFAFNLDAVDTAYL